MKEFAIIVAGGSGSRMQSKTPKQFLLLGGKPILIHTIEVFNSYSEDLSIILVLPENEIPTWKQLCIDYKFDQLVRVVPGGSSRTQSVANGLNAIEENESVVAIHDGVRPLVETETIRNSFKLAKIHGNAVACTYLKESLRFVNKNISKSINRSNYRLIQTPQTFKTTYIKAAYENLKDDIAYTDDASVAEENGLVISLFEGSYENIKITTHEDLLFAEAIIDKKNKAMLS